jgi:hypothetical protein
MTQKHESMKIMKRTYKLIASRGNEIIFDDRLDADSPRHARNELKKLLGLPSLSGIVYSITEIPVDLIRGIVDARIAELAGGAPLQPPVPADVEELVMARLNPILRRLAALEGPPADPARPARFDPLADLPNPTAEPDWTLVARHFRRYRDPARTAAKYGLPLDELNARAAREGWAS